MVLKLLVLMVAMAVLEGVVGLQENQFANETQIKANPDHKKRGRRLDKLPCIMEQGTCQRIGDPCDGIVRQGNEWCLHDRHFECCYPRGCYLDGAVYPNGAIGQMSCMLLLCINGNWYFDGINEFCGICCTYDTTDVRPYVSDPFSIQNYFGPFSFSQRGFKPNPPFGIDITLSPVTATPDPYDNNVDCMNYYEPGIEVVICCFEYPLVWVSLWKGPFFPVSPPPTVRLFASVYIVWIPDGICIIGSLGLSVCVYFVPLGPICPMSVCAYASPFLYNELYGLCDVWNPIPPRGKRSIPTTGQPQEWTMLNGGKTTDTNKFIESWQYPLKRKGRKNPSSDRTGQVTNRTIIERSMSEIEKLCEEMYNGPCTILLSEECEEFKEICVSRISDSQE